MIEATNILVFICHCEPVKSHPEYGKVHHIIAHIMVNDLNPATAETKALAHLMDNGVALTSVETVFETTPQHLLSLDAQSVMDYYKALRDGISMSLRSVQIGNNSNESKKRAWNPPKNQNNTQH